MSAKNQNIKRALKSQYGDGCFFERARIAQRIEAIGGIRTFKSFKEERRYRGKKISYQLTVHHLKHRSEGGANTPENCVNIQEVAHQYIHSLSRDEEEIINNMFREFKINYMIIKNAEVLDYGSIEPSPAADYISIPLEDNTPEQEEALRRLRNKKAKAERLKNTSRARQKEELRKLIDDEDLEL